jgi:hypothetical protein
VHLRMRGVRHIAHGGMQARGMAPPPTSIESRQGRAAIWRSRRGGRIGVFGSVCRTAGRSSRELTMSTRAKAYNSAPGAGFARPGQRQNAPRVSSRSITPAQTSSPRQSNNPADDSPGRLPARHDVKQKDDDELLELGERLASVQPKLVSMLRVDEVRDLVATEVRRRGSWPEDTAEWTWRDAAAYCAARECVERESGRLLSGPDRLAGRQFLSTRQALAPRCKRQPQAKKGLQRLIESLGPRA